MPLARNGQSVCHAQGKSVSGYKMCPYSGGKRSEVMPRVIWLSACVRCFSQHRASAECIHLALDPFSLENAKSVETRYWRSCERCVWKVYTFCYSVVGLKRGHSTFVVDRSFSKAPVIKLNPVPRENTETIQKRLQPYGHILSYYVSWKGQKCLQYTSQLTFLAFSIFLPKICPKAARVQLKASE